MGFADEVKASQGPQAPAASAPEATPELPTGPLPNHGQAYPGTEPAAPAKAPEAAKVRIGDKEFSSNEEALIYAREQVARSEGLKQGVEDTLKATQKPQDETPVVDPIEVEMAALEELMFTDPKAYNRKVLEMTKKAQEQGKADAIAEFQRMTEAQQAEAIKLANYTAYKQGFYQENPDLADFDSIVEGVVMADPVFYNTVKDLPLAEAGQRIAERTRSLLKIKKSAESKVTELPNKGAVFANATGGPGAPSKTVEATSSMDFIAQVNKHRKKG